MIPVVCSTVRLVDYTLLSNYFVCGEDQIISGWTRHLLLGIKFKKKTVNGI